MLQYCKFCNGLIGIIDEKDKPFPCSNCEREKANRFYGVIEPVNELEQARVLRVKE